jgi:hypothetical protein
MIYGQLTVTNTGPIPLLGVTAEAIIPDGIDTFGTSRVSGASASCIGDTSGLCSSRERLVWTVGTLAPGAGVVLSAPFGVASAAGPGQVLTFDASAAEDSGFRADIRGSVRVESDRLLDLVLEPSIDPIEPGAELTYRLSLGNPTTTDIASDVSLVMSLPSGVEALSASDGGVVDGNVVEWALGTLIPGQTGRREVVVVVDDSFGEGEVVHAEAHIEDADGRRTRATAQTRAEAGVPLQLAIELNPDPAQPGEMIAGRVTVTNTGVVPLLGVTAQVFIPDHIETFGTSRVGGASAACFGDTSGLCSARERLVFTIGTLAPGGGVTVTAPFGVADATGTGQVLTFNARAGEDSGFRAGARGSARLESSRLLDLVLEDEPEPVPPGTELGYRLSFGNRTTTSQALGVILRLPLPVGTEFVSASDGGVLNGGDVEWMLGTLSPGQTGARTVVVDVEDGLEDGFVLRAAGTIEADSGKRTRAQAYTRVRAGVPLELALSVTPDPAVAGQLLNAELTLRNTGAIQLLGVQAQLFIPDGINNFGTGQTTGAPAACFGDTSGFCSSRERLVWTVGTIESGAMVTLTAPPTIANNFGSGRVLSFDALASEASGFNGAARNGVRVGSP